MRKTQALVAALAASVVIPALAVAAIVEVGPITGETAMPDRDAETPDENLPQDPSTHPRPARDPGESPDLDPPAWEGPDPEPEPTGLIDPRPDIPRPAGL